jgi:hypothetical protein
MLAFFTINYSLLELSTYRNSTLTRSFLYVRGDAVRRLTSGIHLFIDALDRYISPALF